jgi:ATP-dependent Clp protease ATP-binding subunit ClpX
MSEENLICSFCNKSRKDTKKMIVGAGKVAICNECINLCNEILDEDVKKTNKQKIKEGEYELLNPVKIKEHLDQYVIGQDHAKTVLSVAVANHYKRIIMPPEDFELEKSNVLMLGATGSGKTLLARTIARYLDVPFAIADATALTEAGYVGDDVENVITKLLAAAKGDVELCQRGIVFVDEIDKIVRKSDSASITRDVSGEGVQQALLKIVEGTKCRVPPQGGRKHPDAQLVEIDTTNILFIVGGAFVHLEKQMEKKNTSGIGFGSTIKTDVAENHLADVQPEDLIKYGLIPEFVGRFSMITHVNHLSELQLVKILTEPKNSLIKQAKYRFGLDNIELGITKGARLAIAKKAKSLGTNARALKNILDALLLPYEFDAQEMSARGVTAIEITEETVDKGIDPKLIFKNDSSTKNKEQKA